jgi:hypothetical protein
MAVSRLLKKPIQINLSGLRRAPAPPVGRAGRRYSVGGYTRGGAGQALMGRDKVRLTTVLVPTAAERML